MLEEKKFTAPEEEGTVELKAVMVFGDGKTMEQEFEWEVEEKRSWRERGGHGWKR